MIMTASPIYLDYQATTPTDPLVVKAMMPYFNEYFGNPHSRTHEYGWQAEKAVEKARGQIAEAIGATSKEIIFTSGGTESNNLAIKGVARFYKKEKNHIITCVTEHKCVLDTCRHLGLEGFDITYLSVDKNGLINLQELENAITDKTVLVSIMAVNNEIGVVQPLKEIGTICRSKGVFFHTDAAQAVGKIALDVNAMQIDLLTISAHKIYGPKGIGALYVRRRPRVRLEALINGGGQERGFRSGTLPTPLCVGFGEACQIAVTQMPEEIKRIQTLRDHFYGLLKKNLKDIYLNGDENNRVAGNLNISFAYVEGESLIMGLKDIALSSGSACTSASLEASYVLHAIGVGDDLAHTSLRISIGRFTTQEEIEKAAELIIQQVNKLREMSPLWEMAQEGIDINAIKWSAH